MPRRSRWRIEIPKCSLPTLILKSASEPLDEERPCFLDADRPDTRYLTQSNYRLWCQRFALGLSKTGRFEKGDRLLLFSGNDLFYPVVFMGTVMAGGIFSGANPSYLATELAYQLKDSGARLLLCAKSSMETGVQAARMAGIPTEDIFVFDGDMNDDAATAAGQSDNGPYCSWKKLLASPEDAKTYEWEDLRCPEDACQSTMALNYSSGTTGLFSHRPPSVGR